MMKTLLLSLFSLTIVCFINAQQVERDMVLLEIGTGTWCYYCPGSAMGADDLIANGKDVAVLEHHGPMGSDPFATAGSVARNSYYGITGYPTAWFDGGNAVVGGSNTSTMYGSYLPKYNLRKAIPSSFTLELNGFNDGLDYTVIATAERVAPYSGDNLALHLVLTESEIAYSWQGLGELHFVNRLMVPDHNGTDIGFDSEVSVSEELSFTVNSSWVSEHCELVAFIQDKDTKEVLQATKVMLPDLAPLTMNNAAVLEMSMVPVTNCTGEVAPEVAIMNEGAEVLTSLDINYRINNESLNTYTWSGSLGYGDMEYVMLPSVSFNIMEENSLIVYTTNPNGNPDEDPVNDTTSVSFMSAQQVLPDVFLFLKLDDNPGEITYEVMNESGNVVYSGGPFTTPHEFVKDTFQLSSDDCYTFAIYDAGGDGLTGSGYYVLRQSDFSIIYENQEFSSSEELLQFSTDMVGLEETGFVSEVNLYPNPANDHTTLGFYLDHPSLVEVEVYNLMGEKVHVSGIQQLDSGNHSYSLDLSAYSNGVYFVNLRSGDEIKTLKMTVR